MRVLVQASPTIFVNTLFGGGAVQVLRTVEWLKKLGVKVTISKELYPNLENVDIVHLFGTLEPYYTYLRAKNAIVHGKPVVLSTVFWDWEKAEAEQEKIILYGPVGKRLVDMKKYLRYHLPHGLVALYFKSKRRRENMPYSYWVKYLTLERELGIEGIRRNVIEMADILLPNSEMEYSYLQRRCDAGKPYIVVPNATDLSIESGDSKAFEEKYGLRDFVLCVAAVVPRKNQLRLIKAMRDINVPLVLIGTAEGRYAELCKKQADSKVLFLGQMNQSDIRHAYMAAKVHVLPSFYETPGIASLEAALAGCAIVSTDRGCTKEYFGDDAFYCDPTSEDSIREAAIGALQSGRQSKLKQRVKKRYTWERAAETTLGAYNSVIQRQND